MVQAQLESPLGVQILKLRMARRCPPFLTQLKLARRCRLVRVLRSLLKRLLIRPSVSLRSLVPMISTLNSDERSSTYDEPRDNDFNKWRTEVRAPGTARRCLPVPVTPLNSHSNPPARRCLLGLGISPRVTTSPQLCRKIRLS